MPDIFSSLWLDAILDAAGLLPEPYPSLTYIHPFNGPFSGTRVSRFTRKVKPIWILLKQEIVDGSGISWAICKSAPRSIQITMPAPTFQFFTGQMPFLPPNQQCQSTEGPLSIPKSCVWQLSVDGDDDDAVTRAISVFILAVWFSANRLYWNVCWVVSLHLLIFRQLSFSASTHLYIT